MAGTHRTRRARRFSVALVSAATATATALTVGVEPPPAPAKRVTSAEVDLASEVRLLPNADQVHDITGGLGTTVYDFDQALLDQISRAIVNGISLTAVAQAAGIDPKNLVNGLLADLPANLLPGIIAQLGSSLQFPILSTALGQAGVTGLLTNVLGQLGVSDITDSTLKGLLAVIGLNLSDPLNLSGLAVPGLNVVTSGSPFALLKILGLDLGWTPALPNSVAAAINDTPYLKVGVNGTLNLLLGKLTTLLAGANPLDAALLTPVVNTLTATINGLTTGLPDVIDARVIPTVGVGVGAFAAAMAYKQVLAQLASQPGGLDYTGTDPLLGSLTILPLILINNPGRPDGGAISRFGALASLLGISSVNPTTSLTGSGGVAGPLGLHVGGANVLPVLVDATYEYQPLSDLASWPDPFTLFNNLAAGLSPTYMLRGLSLAGLDTQILSQVGTAVGNATALNPLSLNIYLTLQSSTLPMLEPLYLTSDALNLVGIKPVADFAMHLANALAPALTTLVNIGYADAVQNPDGTISRDFTTAGTETPFLSFPDINFQKALGDSFNQLIGGFQKEFFSGNPTPGTPNVLSTLINALFHTGLASGGTGAGTGGTTTNPLGGLGSLLGGLLGNLNVKPLAATTPVSALAKTSPSTVPGANAKLLSIAPVKTDTAKVDAVAVSSKDATTDKTATTPAAPTTPNTPTATTPATAPDGTTPAADAGSGTSATGAADTNDGKSAKGPKHAKPDSDSTPPAAGQPAGSKHGKHAKPDTDGSAAAGATDASTTGTTMAPKHTKKGGAAASANASGATGSAASGQAA
jgi:hypothetical protein